MGEGALYVRGIGAALLWSTRKDIKFFSRVDLEQINLSQVSLVPTRAQAVLGSWRCSECGMIMFKANPQT